MARSAIEEPGLEPVGAAHGLGSLVGGTGRVGEDGDRIPTAACVRDPAAARPTPTAASSDPSTRLRSHAVQRMTEALSSASQWGQSFTPWVSTTRELRLRGPGAPIAIVPG